MPEIASERRLRKLSERAGQLDPGRPAADDHERQELAAFGLVVAVLRPFEGDEYASSHRRRIVNLLEA